MRRLGRAVSTEAAFSRLFADSAYAFWLDSSGGDAARFSFLGDACGPSAEVLTYRVGTGRVEVTRGSATGWEPGTIFEVLDRRLAELEVQAPTLPFDLVGGYVGFFGYELKADLGNGPNRRVSPMPDAVWIFADRLVVVDHHEAETYLVALTPVEGTVQAGTDPSAANPAAADKAGTDQTGTDKTSAGPDRAGPDTAEEAAERWLAATAAALDALPEASDIQPETDIPVIPDLSAALARDSAGYREDVRRCLDHLRDGLSYELCLTNQVCLPAEIDELPTYLRLRRRSPAPYAALLRLGPQLGVLSASPERFLRIDRDGTAESKPIKGTAPRSADPTRDAELAGDLAADPKTAAENIMIVDLLRNDLGRVCRTGSVEVPRLMAVESYATVHQLVSTVRGRLREDVSAVQCVQACFPGGSMTGAPKARSMRLLESLETTARGVYSGAIGYFGPAGTADLSIVIRTAVRWRDTLTVGAGGAIVLDSDPMAEYDEMLLKAAVPLMAVPQLPALLRPRSTETCRRCCR